MKLATKALYCSLIIVWLSVFIKYKSSEIISRANSQLVEDEPDASENSRFRFRKTFRKGIDKLSDKVKKTDQISDADYETNDMSNSNSRFRDKLKDNYRNVKGHFQVVTEPSKFKPMYNFSSLQNSNELAHEENVKTIKLSPQPSRNVQIPYKPGDSSFTTMIQLSERIIESGNYMRTGQNNHDYTKGTYNSYAYRSGDHAKINGSICSNYLEFGGIVFGHYICPIEGYSLHSTQCCGAVNEQFCCEPVGSQAQINGQIGGDEKSKLFYILIFVPGLLFIIIMSILVFVARKRIWKEQYEGVKKEEAEKEEIDWVDSD